jgi:ADP-heptose:LPS heptosyltransferase
MDKIKIVIYNNFNIGDTFFAQPFLRNIVENNKDIFDFYFLCKFNTCIYTDTIPEIKNVLDYPELLEDFKIYNKDCNYEFTLNCPHNFMIHNYIPNKRILFINTWIANFIKNINKQPHILELFKDNNFEELNTVSYIKYYQNVLDDIYIKYNIKINYNLNDKILLPIFPKLDDKIINRFVEFKNQNNRKLVYLINYPGCSRQPLSFSSMNDFNLMVEALIKKNYIVLLPNKDPDMLNYKLYNNIKDMYFMTDEFNLNIDNTCRNLYYCTKFGNMCDITISFDTGRNYLYMNNEFVNEFINKQNNNKKYHFGSHDTYNKNLLNNRLFSPENYIKFINAQDYKDIVNYINNNL